MLPPAREALMQGALAHLRNQRKACLRELSGVPATIAPEDVGWNPVPLAVYWSCLPEFTVHFFGYAAHASSSSIHYVFVPSNGTERTYSDAAPPEPVPSHGWTKHLVFTFDSGLLFNPQGDAALDEKAKVVVLQHLAVRRFFQKLAWVEDLAAVTKHVRENAQVVGGRQVDPATYYRLCIVLALGAIEALLHDAFFAFRSAWFAHATPGRARKQALREVVNRLAPRRERRQLWRKVKKQADPADVVALVREGSRSRISFQDMRSSRAGAKWAFKAFFGIHLPELVEKAERDTWSVFIFVGDSRQETLHPGEPEEITRADVNRALDKIRKAQCTVLDELMKRIAATPSLRL